MAAPKIAVDGELSGTGLRDLIAGGYMDPTSLGLSPETVTRLADWQSAYEEAHFNSFADRDEVERLDLAGISIAKALKSDLPTAEVRYFSAAKMQYVELLS